jgi:hypothetical protein
MLRSVVFIDFSTILTNAFGWLPNNSSAFFKFLNHYKNSKTTWNQIYFDWLIWCSTAIFSNFKILKIPSVAAKQKFDFFKLFYKRFFFIGLILGELVFFLFPKLIFWALNL